MVHAEELKTAGARAMFSPFVPHAIELPALFRAFWKFVPLVAATPESAMWKVVNPQASAPVGCDGPA
jgi:hypothetical protein